MAGDREHHAASCCRSWTGRDSRHEPAEFGVRTGIGIRYPDVVVDRGEPGLGGSGVRSTPIFIAEVLSPSTAGLDFHDKLQEYTVDRSPCKLI